jgi:hypothetical protein
MAKTYYLGTTKSGAHVGRASGQPYGYTHAATFATHEAGKVVPTSDATFSTNATGAVRNWGSNRGACEVVALAVVDAKTYNAAMGKAAAVRKGQLHPMIASVSSTDHKTVPIAADPRNPAPGTVTPVKIYEVPGKVKPVGEPEAPKRKAAAPTAPLAVEEGGKALNKGDTIVALITRPQGATLDDMMGATGWQAHSVRGFLAAGIKKKGYTASSAKAGGARVYTATAIVPPPAVEETV